MNSLSPLGWILIILLVSLIIGINLSLFLGKKKNTDPDNWVSRIQAAGRTMRDPFHNDDEKLNNLSQKVLELRKTQYDKNSHGDKNERT